MHIFYTRSKLEKFCIESSGRLSFVPTMGALHEGHMKLVQSAKKEGTLVLVSIFINPKQFNNLDDLNKYPVNLKGDLELLSRHRVDASITTICMREIYCRIYHPHLSREIHKSSYLRYVPSSMLQASKTWNSPSMFNFHAYS